MSRELTRMTAAEMSAALTKGEVSATEVPGLGHAFPADFDQRLPGLLAQAGLDPTPG